MVGCHLWSGDLLQPDGLAACFIKAFPVFLLMNGSLVSYWFWFHDSVSLPFLQFSVSLAKFLWAVLNEAPPLFGHAVCDLLTPCVCPCSTSRWVTCSGPLSCTDSGWVIFTLAVLPVVSWSPLALLISLIAPLLETFWHKGLSTLEKYNPLICREQLVSCGVFFNRKRAHILYRHKYEPISFSIYCHW